MRIVKRKTSRLLGLLR